MTDQGLERSNPSEAFYVERRWRNAKKAEAKHAALGLKTEVYAIYAQEDVNVFDSASFPEGCPVHLKDEETHLCFLNRNDISKIEYSDTFSITENCIQCATRESLCPQGAIREGSPFEIVQENCLHCGRCFENCPVEAIVRREGKATV